MRPLHSLTARLTAVTAGVVLALGVAVPAAADTRPADPAEPATVTADALPTVQVDGVVWQQVIVGDRVYVAGDFTSARPAGAAPGVSTVPRANLLAYDLATGELIADFAPTTNAQVLTLAPSPDGSRLYIGGDFTAVNGATVWRVAAIDARTGALITSFLPKPDAKVRAILPVGDTVYFGGLFGAVGTSTRPHLAAVSASNGALLDWAPAASGGGGVHALAMAPDLSKVVAGGSFTTMNGSSSPGYGLAALDPVTGASLPLPVNSIIRNGGDNAAIVSLASDGVALYGTGYTFGSGGNLEGTFAAEWATGALRWVEDCHGDTYQATPVGGVVYQASHKHYCGNIGAFPQTEPWTMYRATAVTTAAVGTATREPYGYFNFEGNPTPAQLNWYPDVNQGTFTGQGQGPWAVTGNADYVVMGGEFTVVNGVAQQGLVRFAVSSKAPNTQGPRITGQRFELTATSPEPGTARLQWVANHDRDNRDLTYALIRNSNTAAPVYQTVQQSTFYQRPAMGFTDTGLTPGATYRYRLRATDPLGNVAWSDTMTVVVSGTPTPASDYADAVLADDPASFWRLDESAGTVRAFDTAGWNDLTVRSGVTRGAAGGTGDTDAASTFDGTTNGGASNATAERGRNTLTLETWVRTTTTRGGKILGFGSTPSSNSSQVDRHLYMDNSGRILFGVKSSGSNATVVGPKAYNDGQWHHVVATLGPDGMRLYVDGERTGSRTDVTKGHDVWGYWRLGGDNLSGWPNRPTSAYLAGDIDDVAVYHRVLSHHDVVDHWVASGRTSPLTPRPADAYGAAVQDLEPDLYWRLGEASGTAAADSSFNATPGVYRSGVTLGTPGALVGVTDTAATFSGASTGLLFSSRQVSNPRIYSTELWFSTTTTAGGKLIGFGNVQSSLSSSYDRHVYMETDGRLTFGVNAGGQVTVSSPQAYNDGQWHHLVAAQSAEGMRLYVDGALVGSNPQAGAQNYAGYWRVGGDRTWGPQPYFAGTIDEVAVYSRALTAEQVAIHNELGRGPLNARPTAAFTETVDGLDVQLDASTSVDTDGTLTAYDWDFGDGVTASGVTTSHTFAAAGTYDVRLTVTDDRGATGSVVRPVTVTDPPPAGVLVDDPFSRTVTGGWGTADIGGAWTLAGAASRFSVAGGQGRMTIPTAGGGAAAYLAQVSSTETDTAAVVGLDKVPNSGAAFLSLTGRRVGADDYRTKLRIASDGVITLYLTRVVGGAEVTLSSGVVPGLTYQTGDRLRLRLEVTGTSPTSLRTKVWKDGQAEPATWQRTGTDASASLQAPGGVGAVSYLSTTTTNLPLAFTVDDLTVVTPGTVPPANQAPVAAFTDAVTELAVQVDGSGSADPDGSITAYAWDFGDGATTTGATAGHTYAAAGTYDVRLTVTDNRGGTGTVVRPVTVAGPPAAVVLATDTFSRAVTGGWGTADVGGAWTLAGSASRFSVADGTGRMTIPSAGGGAAAYLSTVSSTQSDVRALVSLDKMPNAGAVFVSLAGRRVGTDDYRAKARIGADGVVTLYLTKVVGGVETTLSSGVVPGLTLTTGERLWMSVRTSGTAPTTLQTKVWKDGQAEPAAWQRTATDATASLQAPGGIGVVTYLSTTTTNVPLVIGFDELRALQQ